MRREPVKSSTIASVGYDRQVALLELEFASGEVYKYYAVPEKLFRALIESASPGTYFNQHLRDRFPWTKA